MGEIMGMLAFIVIVKLAAEQVSESVKRRRRSQGKFEDPKKR